MKSMTGFGSASGGKKENSLEITIRTVNGRYLDLRMHCPKEYQPLEAEFKKLLRQSLNRGTVDVYISTRNQQQQAQILLDGTIADQWHQAYRQLGKRLKLKDELTLETMVKAPDIFVFEKQQKLSTQEKQMALQVMKKAIAACSRERAREGASLQKNLKGYLTELDKYTAMIGKEREGANRKMKKRYLDRLKNLGIDGSLEPQRFAQEIVMQLDRVDINEELTRLQEHLKVFRRFLTKDSQGKKLDFYSQELLREFNTIGSKAQSAALTQVVVDAKTTIEKIREQVQNIE